MNYSIPNNLSSSSPTRRLLAAFALVSLTSLTGTVPAVRADAKPLPMNPTPLTTAQVALKPGEICTTTFRVATAVRVTDIADRENQRPYEVLLVDVPDDDVVTTPGGSPPG